MGTPNPPIGVENFPGATPRAGFEPAAYSLGGSRSIQLSYRGGVLGCPPSLESPGRGRPQRIQRIGGIGVSAHFGPFERTLGRRQALSAAGTTKGRAPNRSSAQSERHPHSARAHAPCGRRA
jgi:hypothetical protein